MGKTDMRGLSRYIDRIAVLTDEKKIFGVDAIKIKNGYDFKVSPVKIEKKPDKVCIAAVALFAFWHGYERLITGMHEYYESGGTLNYHIHFVGDGPEIETYKGLTNRFQLENRITFHGMRDDLYLEELYAGCQFGCCSLGAYKKGLTITSELKSREYLAAGLPMIKGCNLDIDGEESLRPYIISFPNDASSIDLFAVEKMYSNLYGNRSVDEINDMRFQIWETASRLLGMGQAMNRVIDYINSDR